MLVVGTALAGCADGDESQSATESAPVDPVAVAASPSASSATAAAAATGPQAAAPQPIVLTVSAIGDCAIGDLRHGAGAPGSFKARLAEVEAPLDYPFSGVAHLLTTDDLTIANLEGTLTNEGGAINPVFAIRGKPEYADILVRGGVDVVDVDNNHSRDYGIAGFTDTKAALERHGVGHFGAGVIDRRTVRGLRVVNLGYLGGPRGTRQQMTKDVERERSQADLLIVSFHWGVEASTATHPDQQRLGRAAVDAGADLVLGHHPHVIQGIERYRDRDIVYSLGNFVFGANSQPADMDSMIVQERFRFVERRLVGVEQSILPVRISTSTRHNDFRPVLLEGAERERVAQRIDALSAKLRPERDAPETRVSKAPAPPVRGQGEG